MVLIDLNNTVLHFASRIFKHIYMLQGAFLEILADNFRSLDQKKYQLIFQQKGHNDISIVILENFYLK